MNGIGTYKERTLHASLKKYFEPNEAYHEIKYKGFVADILRDGNIIEIQTGNFNNLRRKFDVMLEEMKVTVVYPAVRAKWLCWINPQNGEITKKRKSPKIGQAYSVFAELYKIKQYLRNPNLTICVLMVDVEEYRILDGWSDDKKRGSHRTERIPVSIGDKIEICCAKEYEKLIPQVLSIEFTSADYKKASGLSMSASQTALNIMYSIGVLERVGKKGNAYIYKKASL